MIVVVMNKRKIHMGCEEQLPGQQDFNSSTNHDLAGVTLILTHQLAYLCLTPTPPPLLPPSSQARRHKNTFTLTPTTHQKTNKQYDNLSVLMEQTQVRQIKRNVRVPLTLNKYSLLLNRAREIHSTVICAGFVPAEFGLTLRLLSIALDECTGSKQRKCMVYELSNNAF